MFAKNVWLIVAMTMFAVQVNAEQIKIAYSGVSAAGTPLWLAKEEGIFTKHGLDADLVAVRSAPLQVTALVSNEVQFVRGSVSSMLTAAAQGAKLKIILSLFAERASYDFLAAPSITRPADLKGKKIGVQDFSGLLWTLTMLSLRELGLDPQRDNINIQAIGDSTVIAQSLASGIIDAAALDKLQSVRLQGQGVKVLLDLRRIAFPSSPFMGAEPFIEKNPKVVENFIKALIEASTIMRAQKERGLAVLQKHIKTDRALAEIGYKNLLEDLTAYTFTSIKGLKTVQEIVALRDPKIAKYNVEDLLDQRILKKVVDSGYVEEIERRYKIRS
ncbi:MAG TPA: ABC transporter substrate-binding protein [Phototrophicaceae bacterium]|jgi:NitT/TauT family transport system substrate-binding protein|nr:ABC transporter substrate-binding protein [Phototrophicaceae bacterium]